MPHIHRRNVNTATKQGNADRGASLYEGLMTGHYSSYNEQAPHTSTTRTAFTTHEGPNNGTGPQDGDHGSTIPRHIPVSHTPEAVTQPNDSILQAEQVQRHQPNVNEKSLTECALCTNPFEKGDVIAQAMNNQMFHERCYKNMMNHAYPGRSDGSCTQYHIPPEAKGFFRYLGNCGENAGTDTCQQPSTTHESSVDSCVVGGC